jgi:Tfp pilus assembly protein PilX
MSTSVHRSERGAASLAVTLLLLFGISIIVFYANRSLIFEQKTSANQMRSTIAFEAAEAGLEWALGQLNDPRVLDAAASCTPATTPLLTSVSFRGRYITPTAASGSTPAGFYPPANARAACSIAANGTLTCDCPLPGTAPTLDNANAALPRFRVEFRALAGDPVAVEVLSIGCTSADAQCGDTAGTASDATSVSRTIVKLVPTFSNTPNAALVSGAATTVSGNLSVVNTDQSAYGVTINAGTTVDEGSGTTVATLPGTPPSASILPNDPSLSTLSAADADGNLFFQSFFGKSMEAYRADPQTKVITASDCGTATACGALVSSWYNKGFQQFWVYPDVQFTNANLPLAGTLGT